MSSGNSSQPPRRPPHITVNSGSGGDILAQIPSFGEVANSTSTSTLGSEAATSSRPLVPRPPATSSRPSTAGSDVSRAGPYGPGASVPQSSEMLLPPSRSLGGRPKYQDVPSEDYAMSNQSGLTSRRTSFSSHRSASRDSRFGPFFSPFDDSRPVSRAGSSDDDHVNTQTVSEKYNIMPSAGLLLYPEDVEKDDYLHNPDPSDNERNDCNIFNRRGLVNVGGLAFLTLGLLVLFVGYPIITFARRQHLQSAKSDCQSDPMCLSDKLPLLQNVRTGPIDPDTPESAQTKTDKDGTKLKLVFSDEFSKPGRTFYDGDDPYFQAVDIWYGATQDMEWYDPDAVSTANGTLNLQFDAFQSHNLNYRSGMVQSWNKLCYKGGRIEASISLPGRGDIQGFWPGFWTMGNLGRPGYLATTDGMWPYSYHDECDAGITKNQSSSDGLSWLPGMRLPACTCDREDHPTPGKSRQAPEIDAIEASVGFMIPGGGGATGTASQSFQAAPFDIWYQPDYDYTEIYDTAVTEMNTYRGGPFQQALSGVTWLNNDWYDGKAYQTYGFEYEPGAKGKVAWFVGDTYTWTMDTRATRANGNIGQRVLPEEPMSIIMNFGLSNSFAQVFLADLAKLMPATMRLDYVRIYQEEGKESLTCDPEGYETTEYIKAHPEPYANPNLTLWEDTKYSWPKNSLVDGCAAEE